MGLVRLAKDIIPDSVLTCLRFHYVTVYICAILLRLQLMAVLAGDTKIKVDCVHVLNYVRDWKRPRARD